MIQRVLLCGLLCSLMACGDDPTGPEDVAGTYALQTVDGEGAPFTQVMSPAGEDGSRELIETTAGQTALDPDSTCELRLTVETSTFDQFGAFMGKSSADVTHPCTFELGQATITLDYGDGTVDTGSITGSTLTLTRGGSVWVFER